MPRITMTEMEVDDDAPPPPPSLPLSECFPELVPIEELRATLLRFEVNFDESSTSHEELLRLYRQLLCPKPQRTTARNNRRGQQIQIKQIRREKAAKRKAEIEASSSSVAKSAKFAPAQSVFNAKKNNNGQNSHITFQSNGNNSTSALNLDPVNGRLKPAPMSSSSKKSDADSKSSVKKTTDTLAHIKINEGPTKKRRDQVEAPSATTASGIATAATPEVVSSSGASDEKIDPKSGKFWDLFGSVSHAIASSSPSSSSSVSSSPTAKKIHRSPAIPKQEISSSNLNSTLSISTSNGINSFKRVIKLNRTSVLPQEVAELTSLQQPKQQKQPMENNDKTSTPPTIVKKSPPAISVSPSAGSPRCASMSNGSSPRGSASPCGRSSPNRKLDRGFSSDSGSDMDITEATPSKNVCKSIAKITWP